MIFASACWCCHQCILSAQILTTLMAAGIDSAMHLRSFSASLLPWDIPAVAPLWQSLSDRFITHPGVQDHLRMFELLDLLQARVPRILSWLFTWEFNLTRDGETTSRWTFVHAPKIMWATCWKLLLTSLYIAHNMLIYVTPEVRLRWLLPSDYFRCQNKTHALLAQ